MKITVALILSLFCLNTWAFVTQVERFEKNSLISEKKALSLVHDTFLYRLWQEASGKSCGGDFKALEVALQTESAMVIRGVATQGLDNCEKVQEVAIEMEIELKTNDVTHSSISVL